VISASKEVKDIGIRGLRLLILRLDSIGIVHGTIIIKALADKSLFLLN
jgi:hypothetical protein